MGCIVGNRRPEVTNLRPHGAAPQHRRHAACRARAGLREGTATVPTAQRSARWQQLPGGETRCDSWGSETSTPPHRRNLASCAPRRRPPVPVASAPATSRGKRALDLVLVLGTRAAHVAARPADGRAREAHVPRPGAVRPGAGRPRRRALHDVQVPHDAPRRRAPAAAGPGAVERLRHERVQGAGRARPAHHPARALPPPVEPRRAPADPQRAHGPDEPRRPAAGGPRRGRELRRPARRSTCRSARASPGPGRSTAARRSTTPTASHIDAEYVQLLERVARREDPGQDADRRARAPAARSDLPVARSHRAAAGEGQAVGVAPGSARARAARTLAIRLSGTCSWHLRRTTSRSSASKSYGSAHGWHSSR